MFNRIRQFVADVTLMLRELRSLTAELREVSESLQRFVPQLEALAQRMENAEGVQRQHDKEEAARRFSKQIRNLEPQAIKKLFNTPSMVERLAKFEAEQKAYYEKRKLAAHEGMVVVASDKPLRQPNADLIREKLKQSYAADGALVVTGDGYTAVISNTNFVTEIAKDSDEHWVSKDLSE